jgi:energy-coupling factor transport system permease protein
VSFLPQPLGGRPDALLARVSGVTRLVAGLLWLLAAVLTTQPITPALICLAALVVLFLWSGLDAGRVAGRFGPVFVGALGLAAVAAVFSPLNADPSAAVVLELGPLRVTVPALSGALALGLRLVAIALTSVLVFGPGEVTGLADSLVQQAHLPDRFAYGSVAALGLVPLLAADWEATSVARRLRGLDAGPWRRVAGLGGRLLTLLVSAIRRAGRMALAMDARGFDSGRPRSRYRPVRLGLRDVLVIVVAAAVAALALLAAPGP